MPVTPVQSLTFLGAEDGMEFHESAMASSTEGKMIDEALGKMGLHADLERTQLFTLYSRVSKKAIALSVTPYNTDDQKMEAGLSISEGGHAQAVVVYLANRVKIERFTTLAVDASGKLVQGEFSAGDLMDAKARGLLQKAGRVKAAKPLVEVSTSQSRSMGNLTFNTLLVDKKSRTVHNEDEIKALRANSAIVSEISQFVLLRTQGSACCSCSCSCWGSSSCSCSYAG